jgi:hypothetical protein
VSDIIKGPNERFWAIKLVDKMVDPKITLATEKEKDSRSFTDAEDRRTP